MAERSSASRREPAPQAIRPDEGDPEFEQWLDGRLKTMYSTVLNEPLPDEILKLLKTPKGD